ncbi:MAG: M20/M25/M40 family metallo-hydrolase [Thermoproteota archaeon]
MIDLFAAHAIKRIGSEELSEWAQRLLMELLYIDNTPKPNMDLMRRNEEEAFKIIESEIKDLCKNLKPEVRRVPINVELIEKHLYITPPHYTKTDKIPFGLSIEETYRNRANMVITVDGIHGKLQESPTICAHIDTVAPHLSNVRCEAGTIYGRGACDDKGSIVSMIEALRLISEFVEMGGKSILGRSILLHFVIDEEPGGNGALSLALDEEYTSNNILVAEATDLIPHRANRGALWFKVRLSCGTQRVEPLMTLSNVILSLEEEGDKILQETSEGIFLKEHVQTSHGIVSAMPCNKTHEVRFGQHPSTVNGYVKFTVLTDVGPETIREEIDRSIKLYVAKYGDKTLEIDPETGSPKVSRHFNIVERRTDAGIAYDVEIFGKTGHMGAIRQCDCAIIKMAYVLNDLRRLTLKRDSKIHVFFSGCEGSNVNQIVLEGGQGFTASHNLEDIQSRITSAVNKGISNYLSALHLPPNSIEVETSFDKLHNDAYESPEDSDAWNSMIEACRLTGLPLNGEEKRAWRVSCDARVYAKAPKILDPSRSIRNVITFGAGSLRYAHSDVEQVATSDILIAGSTMAIWAMKLSKSKLK